MKYKILLVVGICLGSVILAACGNQQPEVLGTEIVTTLVEETESEMETETEELKTEEPETETEEPEQEPESEQEPEFESYTRFTNTEANIRNLPTADGSEVVKTVPVNTEVTVIGITGDWSKVKSDDGSDLYIKSSLLGEAPVETIASASSQTSASSTSQAQSQTSTTQQQAAAAAAAAQQAIASAAANGIVIDMTDTWDADTTDYGYADFN